MNFVPCLAWVKKGIAKAIPVKVKLLKEQFRELVHANETVSAVDEELVSSDFEEQMKGDAGGIDAAGDMDADGDIDAKYDLDGYDDEADLPLNVNQLTGLVVFASNADDPYMSGKSDEESEEEVDAYTIRPSDNLLVVARVDEDCATIEIYVSNEAEDHFYVHHDIVVEAYPVCMEWLNYDPTESEPGNLVAVGDMTPVINVWDLDVVDSLEPAFRLGRMKKKKSYKPSDGHSDAVITLSWNRQLRRLLASGSADNTIITWDLAEGAPENIITGHTDKVQSVHWHPYEPTTLLSGASDCTVKIWDCRSQSPGCKTWSVRGEVEKVLWNHLDPFYFYASTDTGHVYGFDARSDQAVFTLPAHPLTVTSMALSSHCPGCLVTASADKKIKIWDVLDHKPVLVHEMDVTVGAILAMASSPDDPFVLAAGGDNPAQCLRVINLKSYAEMSQLQARHPVQTADVAWERGMETDAAVGALEDLSLAGPSKRA